ncbi:phenylacetate--CoA ligase family protein [Campylobacter geochelonis]|uniref:phenylacetate--CoA ligase family protein n=1 Tax=Campylobacter geochelonis TaxID=1780362 RepID=UPI000770A744|nr:phenylacetate--CoA ligase [Campylobacter geochelonis]CZE48244.1 Phenylacetate-coenzyme A ligase [Campylobacter geochelonis]
MIWSKEETLSKDELRNVQNTRFAKMLERIYSNVEFYKAKFDQLGIKPQDIKSVEQLCRLPFTTKKDLRAHYPFGLFATPQSEVVRIHSSSGTSGKPTVVGYTKEDMRIWCEVLARVFSMAGVGKDDVVHNAYGYGLFTGGLGVHYGAETVGAAVVPSSSGFTSRQLMLMRDFGATAITCTPSFVMHLADHAKAEGYDLKKDFKLKCGIFGAEPTSEALKKQIANVWGIKYHDIYGLSEIIGPGVAGGCGQSHGLHIFEDHFYPEIINPKTGIAVPDGENGELVVTTLTKEAIPLLRYRTGDMTSIKTEICHCGRTHRQIMPIIGRSDDMLIINGVNVFPSQIEHVLSKIEGTSLNYQVIVYKKGYLDKIDILVEFGDDFCFDSMSAIENLTKEISSQLLTNLFIHANVKLVEPRTIEVSDTKTKRIIDKRS